jgi:hypothetical protein
VSEDEAPEGAVLVRATVNLPGLRFGEYAYVDPEDEYMGAALRSSLLVLAEPEEA